MHEGEAGNIPAWARETDSEPAFHRVHQNRGDDRRVALGVQSVGADALWHDDIDR